jgi:hypothetical protein
MHRLPRMLAERPNQLAYYRNGYSDQGDLDGGSCAIRWLGKSFPKKNTRIYL